MEFIWKEIRITKTFKKNKVKRLRTECVPQNSHIEDLALNVMLFGGKLWEVIN